MGEQYCIDKESCWQSSISHRVISRKENAAHKMRSGSQNLGLREILGRAQATCVS